jgi:hypothetical protein
MGVGEFVVGVFSFIFYGKVFCPTDAWLTDSYYYEMLIIGQGYSYTN